MAKVKYRVREYTPTDDDDNTQTGGGNTPGGELEG